MGVAGLQASGLLEDFEESTLLKEISVGLIEAVKIAVRSLAVQWHNKSQVIP